MQMRQYKRVVNQVSRVIWWGRGMETLSALLALCGWNPLVICNAELWCFLCKPKQFAAQTVELPAIWDSMTFIGHSSNDKSLSYKRISCERNISIGYETAHKICFLSRWCNKNAVKSFPLLQVYGSPAKPSQCESETDCSNKTGKSRTLNQRDAAFILNFTVQQALRV